MFTAYWRKNGKHLRNAPLLPHLSQMVLLGLECKPLKHWGKEDPSAWGPLNPLVSTVMFLPTWLLLPLLAILVWLTNLKLQPNLTSAFLFTMEPAEFLLFFVGSLLAQLACFLSLTSSTLLCALCCPISVSWSFALWELFFFLRLLNISNKYWM